MAGEVAFLLHCFQVASAEAPILAGGRQPTAFRAIQRMYMTYAVISGTLSAHWWA